MSELYQLLHALYQLVLGDLPVGVQALVAAQSAHLAVRGVWKVPGDLYRAARAVGRGAGAAGAGVRSWWNRPSQLALLRHELLSLRRDLGEPSR